MYSRIFQYRLNCYETPLFFYQYAVPTELVLFLRFFSTNISFLMELCNA